MHSGSEAAASATCSSSATTAVLSSAVNTDSGLGAGTSALEITGESKRNVAGVIGGGKFPF